MLGKAEMIGAFSDRFVLEDKEQKIYFRKSGEARIALEFEPATFYAGHSPVVVAKPTSVQAALNPVEVQPQMERIRSATHAPAAVIVDEDENTIHVDGNITPYPRPSQDLPHFALKIWPAKARNETSVRLPLMENSQEGGEKGESRNVVKHLPKTRFLVVDNNRTHAMIQIGWVKRNRATHRRLGIELAS